MIVGTSETFSGFYWYAQILASSQQGDIALEHNPTSLWEVRLIIIAAFTLIHMTHENLFLIVHT